METFAQRLKKALEEEKLTQRALAQKANITPAAVNSYLKGIYLPKETTLKKIAKALSKDADWLRGDTPFRKPLKNSEVRRVKIPVLDIKVK